MLKKFIMENIADSTRINDVTYKETINIDFSGAYLYNTDDVKIERITIFIKNGDVHKITYNGGYYFLNEIMYMRILSFLDKTAQPIIVLPQDEKIRLAMKAFRKILKWIECRFNTNGNKSISALNIYAKADFNDPYKAGISFGSPYISMGTSLYFYNDCIKNSNGDLIVGYFDEREAVWASIVRRGCDIKFGFSHIIYIVDNWETIKEALNAEIDKRNKILNFEL